MVAAFCLVVASCSNSQTTVASDTTTAEGPIEEALITTTEPFDDVDTPLETTGTSAVDLRDETTKTVDFSAFEDGVYCLDRPTTAIERAEFENRLNWGEAPAHLVAELMTQDQSIGDLGIWRLWPETNIAIMIDPVSEPLQIYATSSDTRGVTACVIVSTITSIPAPALTCHIEAGSIGPTVFVSGVPDGATIAYLVDGELAAEIDSWGIGNDGVAEQLMLQALNALAESPMHVESDQAFPQRSGVYELVWIESGQTVDVSVRAQIGGEIQTVDCGQGTGLVEGDLQISCAVTLVDGLPSIEVQNPSQIHPLIYRNGVEVPLHFGIMIDLTAERGIPLVYTAQATTFRGSPLVAECGTVEVSNELPLEVLLQTAQPGASNGFGPHLYWRVTPTCVDCPTEPTTIYLYVLDQPVDPWGLPDSHPGIHHPGTVHQLLLDAIAVGSDVQATVNQMGYVTSYSIDGQGIASDCFLVDTLPPELVGTGPGADIYCGYVD